MWRSTGVGPDFFLEYVVAPALKEFNLRVIRADQIGKPGMIGKQVLEHILKSSLVIADLSFHNPNVFYELCLRHVARLPTVQIIRGAEAIAFDIEQYRTIKIDTTDLYGFLPSLQTYISEIANQVRRVLEDPEWRPQPDFHILSEREADLVEKTAPPRRITELPV